MILTKLAQLQQHAEADRNRYQHAIEILKEAEKQVNELMAEIKGAMAEHDEKGEALKEDAAARREQPAPAMEKGKGKERAVSDALSDEQDSEDKGLPRNPAGEEHATRRRALQHRLREAKVVLHKVKFLQGDVYHMLGEAFKSAEDAAYAVTDEIRRDLLKGAFKS